MKFRRFVYCLILASYYLISFNSNVLAIPSSQSNGSALTSSPVSLNLNVKPGSSVSSTIEFENNTTLATNVSISLEGFRAYGTSGQAQIFQLAKNSPIFSWVRFSKNNVLAQPNVWNKVNFTISLPANAQLGYYLAVILTPNRQISNPKTVAKYQGANAILVLVNTNSANEQQKLAIVKFASAQSIYQFLPATFQLTIHNSGNIYTSPQGDIYISRTMNGPVIASLAFNPSAGNILPNSSRTFTVNWNQGFPVYQFKRVNNQIVSNANGQPDQNLNWNVNNLADFRIGQYYAKAVVVYSNNNIDVPLKANLSFEVLPWVIIIISLIIIILILFGGYFLIKKFVLLKKGSPAIKRSSYRRR